jgi:hypothetical protein
LKASRKFRDDDEEEEEEDQYLWVTGTSNLHLQSVGSVKAKG